MFVEGLVPVRELVVVLAVTDCLTGLLDHGQPFGLHGADVGRAATSFTMAHASTKPG
jgi:hypothetical protein